MLSINLRRALLPAFAPLALALLACGSGDVAGADAPTSTEAGPTDPAIRRVAIVEFVEEYAVVTNDFAAASAEFLTAMSDSQDLRSRAASAGEARVLSESIRDRLNKISTVEWEPITGAVVSETVDVMGSLMESFGRLERMSGATESDFNDEVLVAGVTVNAFGAIFTTTLGSLFTDYSIDPRTDIAAWR